MFTIQCPACQRVLQAPSNLCGTEVRCPGCAHTWALPAAPEALPAGAARPTGVVTSVPVVGTRADVPPSALAPEQDDIQKPGGFRQVLLAALAIIGVSLGVLLVWFLMSLPAPPTTRPFLVAPGKDAPPKR
jgi:hypothetical protein